MVAKIRVVPSSIRKAEMVLPGEACIGLAVWAKARGVCSATTSPAVDRAVRNMRSRAPMARPTMTSRMIQPAMPPTVTGRPGRAPATTGHRASDMTSASDRRMRGGT